MARDYYATLEVPKTADEKQIKTAYRRLARKFHPDVKPADLKTVSKPLKELYLIVIAPQQVQLVPLAP